MTMHTATEQIYIFSSFLLKSIISLAKLSFSTSANKRRQSQFWSTSIMGHSFLQLGTTLNTT